MPKTSALAGGRLVEYLDHTAHEIVVKGGFPDLDPRLLTFADLVSGATLNLLIQPIIVAFNAENSNRLGFHMERVFWCDVRQALPKGKDVWLEPGIAAQAVYHPCRIIQVFVPI